MRRYGKVFLVFLAAALCAFLAWHWLRPRTVFDQAYNGRSLTEWTRLLTPAGLGSPPMRAEARAAVRALSTNNFPALVEALNYDPTVRNGRFKRLRSWVQHLPAPVENWFLEGPLADPAEQRAITAGLALKSLGSDAAPAIPALEKLCLTTNVTITRQVFYVLPYVGTNGIQSLLAMMDNEKHPQRAEAASTLNLLLIFGSTNITAAAALHVFVRSMKSPDPRVASYATTSLGVLKAEPGMCVPLLIAALTNSSQEVRTCAVAALRKFGPNAHDAVPELVRLSRETDLLVVIQAMRALQSIAPDVYTNVLAGMSNTTARTSLQRDATPAPATIH